MQIQLQIKRELFRFVSEDDWVWNGRKRYAECGVRADYRIGIDAQGHAVHIGECFRCAKENNAYPIVIYELMTNWNK